VNDNLVIRLLNINCRESSVKLLRKLQIAELSMEPLSHYIPKGRADNEPMNEEAALRKQLFSNTLKCRAPDPCPWTA
jgi:hypothetical protein